MWTTIGPDVDGGIVLSGHTDVVPTKGQPWSSDPFVLREIDGKLYARGACDMKGFDAAVLAMVPAFQAANLKRPIHVLLSYDEETTGRGSLDVIAAFGVDLPRPALVIVGEPTMMAVADAHKGIATFETRVTGVEAHSAKPQLGASAISAACAIVAEISRLGRELEAPDRLDPRFDPPWSTFHVGVIHGGTAHKIPPANACSSGTFAACPIYRRRWRSRSCKLMSTRSLCRVCGASSPGRISRQSWKLKCRASPPRPHPRPRPSRCGSADRTGRSRFPTRRRPGISSAPACRPWSAAPGSIEQGGLARRVPVEDHRVPVQGAGQAAHGQRVGTVAVDDLQRGGQHGIAGDLAAAVGGGPRGAGGRGGHDRSTVPSG